MLANGRDHRRILALLLRSLKIAALPAAFASLALAASASAVTCTITGTAGNDRLAGTAGNDVICGLGGNDQLNGRGGNDVLLGEAGDDLLIGEDDFDDLDGGDDFDTANYNPGADQRVDVDLATGTVFNDGRGFAESIADVERVEGARNEQNVLTGDAGPNKLIGGLLDDIVQGGGGADLLRGEPERAPSGMGDTILGNDGNDVIFPGLGANSIDGGQGATSIDLVSYGSLAVDSGVTVTLSSGDGTATGAVSDGLASVENVTGTPNADSITVAWNGVASEVRGREGDDTLFINDGDTLDFLNGGVGGDTCAFDAGDTVKNCP